MIICIIVVIQLTIVVNYNVDIVVFVHAPFTSFVNRLCQSFSHLLRDGWVLQLGDRSDR